MQPADTAKFKSEELALVDWWITHISDKHTAVSISDLSHDYGWEVAKMGEELPTFAFLARRIREPKIPEEIDWALSEAKRLKLS